MKRKNCWEVMDCGLNPGGHREKEVGVCPVTIPNVFDQINRGDFAGRFCWAIEGTLCMGNKQKAFAHKLLDCIQCKFFQQVQDQEGMEFVFSPLKAKEWITGN